MSGANPAVILGDLNAGRGYFDDPNNFIFPEGEATLNLLEGTFTPAYAANYTPACTFCQDNPVAGVEREGTVWIDHIHMYNLPASAVTATERTFDQNVLTVPDGNGGTIRHTALRPLRDAFGHRRTLERLVVGWSLLDRIHRGAVVVQIERAYTTSAPTSFTPAPPTDRGGHNLRRRGV